MRHQCCQSDDHTARPHLLFDAALDCGVFAYYVEDHAVFVDLWVELSTAKL